MTKVSVRDLRTRFPAVRAAVQREGEVVVTDHGEPVMVLSAYTPRAKTPPKRDYFARLSARMPKPLTAAQRRALDADRDER